MKQKQALRDLADSLARGEVSCEAVIRESLERARDNPDVFVAINDQALDQAAQIDQLRRDGDAPAFAGVPISVKDLFDVAGEPTLAGSVVLKQSAEPASRDADVISPLRDAGMLILGRTNMSEFAFSGMGLNPHYPPLRSVWDRDTGRLPGGSSSGSAVSVALGIVPGTLGSDTAGSCRIPAAFNGIVGVKPSVGRLSGHGVYPLSHTSDAPGPLGADVDSCFVLERLMQGRAADDVGELQRTEPDSLRLLVPEGRVMSELDPAVADAFAQAVEQLATAGVTIVRESLAGLDDSVELFLKRPVAVYEAWQHHRQMLEQNGDLYDPYVRKRISPGANISEQEQQARYDDKAQVVRTVEDSFRALQVDAVIYPTVACLPPPVTETEDPDRIGVVNLHCLRNTASVNYFDGCAISLPCQAADGAPVGLMVSALNGMDDQLFRVAGGLEILLDCEPSANMAG